jgi:hypothetical protein
MIPLFVSDHSLTDSVLTIGFQSEKDRPDLNTPAPVGIFSIAAKHKLPRVVITDSSISGFWSAFKTSKECGVPFTFGLKLCLCQNEEDKTPDSLRTESGIIVFAKNSQGYKDLIAISSHASLHGFYYRPRIGNTALKRLWTDNLTLGIPFYSSFIARNTLEYAHMATPEFPVVPTFFSERHGLPFEGLIQHYLNGYVDQSKQVKAHTVYYYSKAHARAHQALKCIGKRSTLECPNLEHYSSSRFGFDNFLENS